MPLHGKLAIRALQFLFSDGAGYPQYLVVIAFCVCGQNRMPFFFFEKISLDETKQRNELHNYFPGFFATFTIAGRSSRSFNL